MGRLFVSLAALVSLVTSVGCQGVIVLPGTPESVVVKKPGPPSHAPAHGHRRKHAGADLRFDPQLGVYVVFGHRDLYFHNGSFIRIHGSTWQVSHSIGGPWEPRPADWVPRGLHRKHHHHVKKSKGKGRGPAKGRW